jgi:flavorubredoxin
LSALPTLPHEVCAKCRSRRAHSELRVGARRYKHWSEGVEKATARVAVLYASDYGFSDRLSQTLARGITKAGVAVEMLDILSADPQA